MLNKVESLSHTTFQEMLFIDNLGYYSEIKNRDQKLLLQKYIAAISKRHDWTNLDRDAIRRHALRRLLEAA